MIEKVIHYCWFGKGEMSNKMKKCLNSWKKYCPNYRIIEWNEDNFDIESTQWTKEAYAVKKYAFVSDYVRLKVLYEHGGIYMDTDVELIKPIDPFLKHHAFSGFEGPESAPTGIIAAEKNHHVIKRWLDWYKDRPYLVESRPNMDPNVSFMTADLIEHGLVMDNTKQVVDDMIIYPQTFFCPLYLDKFETCMSRNTVCIHHFTSTWRSAEELKKFRKAKFRNEKWYQKLEYIVYYIRYFPQKSLRKILGDEMIESIKKRVK